MRLFLAIELTEAWRRAAEAATAALAAEHARSLRVVRPELLHLTVRFLGEVDEARVEPLQAVLAEQVPPMEVALALGAAGTFGPAARTGAVWLGVDGDLDRLRALATRVEAALADAGLPDERREPRPHLTLARVRRQAGAGERRAIAALVRGLATPEAAPFVARELVLVRSRLGADGPRYEPLARF